jgi:hypothetical protein
MSAHYSAPGLRRAQLATPSYPVIRRKALFVAAATLCAPAFAALALAAIGAAGGGDQAAMGSLAGTEGLRGSTTPSLSSPPPATQHKQGRVSEKGDGRDSTAGHQAQKHPVAKAPTPAPAHRPAPTTRPPHTTPTPQVTAPSLPTTDPSQPGAPTSSGTTSGSGGTSGSGTGTTSGSGSGSTNHGGSGGTDGGDAYPGGG